MSAASNYLGSQKYVVTGITRVVTMITLEVTRTIYEVTAITVGSPGDYIYHVTTQVVTGCTWVTTPNLVKMTTFSFQWW